MASLRKKDRSPFWFACFTLPDGTRTQRSTGATDRRAAERIANQYEDAAKEASAGRFIESRARKTIADIFAIANVESLPSSSVADFFESWLKRKELEAGDKTHAKYSSVVKQFQKYLGPKGKRDVSNLVAADFSGFRDELAKRVTTGTVNVALKILKAAFNQAKRDGLIDVNEAERVTILKRRDRFERRAFSLMELRQILEVANNEWRGMILFGLYTGQRLGDISALTWQNIDLQRGELRLITGKTNRRQIIPLAAPVVHYLEELPSMDQPDAPLFSRAFSSVQRNQTTGTLSNEFYRLLVSANLAKAKSHKIVGPNKTPGKGRGAKRVQNDLSFHSLRHTATTLLKNAGVSESVAMEFIGHDSRSVSRQYTHIDTATLKLAAAKLPDVTKG